VFRRAKSLGKAVYWDRYGAMRGCILIARQHTILPLVWKIFCNPYQALIWGRSSHENYSSGPFSFIFAQAASSRDASLGTIRLAMFGRELGCGFFNRCEMMAMTILGTADPLLVFD
jgi:hypothetical protein